MIVMYNTTLQLSAVQRGTAVYSPLSFKNKDTNVPVKSVIILTFIIYMISSPESSEDRLGTGPAPGGVS